MNNEILRSMRRLVEYVKNTEAGHFEECNDEGKKHHVYNDAARVQTWLDSQIELPESKCPQCGEMTLEIDGEGILSDGGHYRIEQCRNCNYPL